jgi:PhoU domain
MRAAFDQELTELRARLVELGEMVQTQLDHALAALATGDPDAIQGIVGGDQQIDQLSAEIDWGLLRTLACQAPVASDLRLAGRRRRRTGLFHRHRRGPRVPATQGRQDTNQPQVVPVPGCQLPHRGMAKS